MKNKKCVAILLCVVMVLSMFVSGCGGTSTNSKKNKVDNTKEDTTNLNIMLLAMGYGSDWLFAAAEAFEAKNEGVKVNIELTHQEDVIGNTMRNPEDNDFDLIFDVGSGYTNISSFANLYEGGQAMRDLTHLYNTEIPGEGITLGDKMNATIRQSSMLEGRDTEDTSDDVSYFVPYMTGVSGLCYNETVIDNALGKGNWELPKTTDELEELCKKLKDKGCSLLVPGGVDYWSTSCYLTWWAQYEGLENYKKFFDGIGYNTSMNREEKRSNLIYQQPGRLAAAEASYDFLSYDKGYVIKNAVEINANNLNEYQTRFMIAKNNYAIYACGDWLMQEVQNNTTVELDSTIKFMQTPVISSIIDSTNSYSAGKEKRLPNITSDEMLSQVISYIDGEGELPAGVTEEEVEFVKSARHMVASHATGHIAYSPAYCNAKTLADQFLLFLASDEGIQILKDNCAGGFAPYNYEYAEGSLHEFEESIAESMKDAVYIGYYPWSELFLEASVKTYAINTYNCESLCAKGALNGKELNDLFIKEYSGDKWQVYLKRLSVK